MNDPASGNRISLGSVPPSIVSLPLASLSGPYPPRLFIAFEFVSMARVSKSTVLVSHPGLSQHAPRFGPGTLQLSSQPFTHFFAFCEWYDVISGTRAFNRNRNRVFRSPQTFYACHCSLTENKKPIPVITNENVKRTFGLITQAPVFGSFSFFGSHIHSSNLSQTPSSSTSVTF